MLDLATTKKDYSVGIVRGEPLRFFWPRVVELLEATKETWNVVHTVASIAELVVRDALQVWIVLHQAEVVLAALTEWEEYPSGKVIRVVWGSGTSFDDYGAMALAGVEAYARHYKAIGVVVQGRLGFQRKLAPLGYEVQNVTVMKTLTKEWVN